VEVTGEIEDNISKCLYINKSLGILSTSAGFKKKVLEKLLIF
jgi:hypothetical protein